MTTVIVRSDLDRTEVEREVLPDGQVVWIARDLDLDGCLAQGESREAALGALEDARSQYSSVLEHLGRSSHRFREVVVAGMTISSRSRPDFIRSDSSATVTTGF